MILTCLVILVLFLSGYLNFHTGKAGIQRRLSLKGVEAQAILLNMEQTGLYINQQPQVKMQMQVQPRTGRNFVAETCEVLSIIEMGRLRTGSMLRVRYNPADIRELVVLQYNQ